MRFFHISDLHIGKQLYYYSLRENQRAVLRQIADLAGKLHPDGILLAGDIFDKSVPSGEAYTVLDEFLNNLAEITPKIPVFLIAGNHDSAERLRYASSFLERHQIYISVLPPQSEEEHLKKIVLQDEYGPVNLYLLPFTKPGFVRWMFPEGTSVSYDMAVQAVLEREEIDWSQRNILLSHQFYVSGILTPETCDSELAYLSAGGIDSVDTSRISRFDYAALGHLHGAQWIGKPSIRYCGTPLKYSVSEAKQEKSVTLVTLKEKETPVRIETIPLEAVQDVRKEQGTLEELLERAGKDESRNDFISITLTDEKEIFRPKEQLEEYYPYILEIRVDNSRTRARLLKEQGEAPVLDPLEAFKSFYREIQGQEMSPEETAIVADVILQVKEEEQ